MTENTVTLIVMHLVLGAIALNRLWPNPLPDDDYKYRIAWSFIAVLVPAVGPLMALAFYQMPEADEDGNPLNDIDTSEDEGSARDRETDARAKAAYADRIVKEARALAKDPLNPVKRR